MSAQHFLITGGHSGLGLELTKLAIAKGHRVSLLARSRQRVDDLGPLAGRITHVFEADLADASARSEVCEEIATRAPDIDVLVNNAAVLLPELLESPQGNEMHYEVNAIAPIDLMERLRSTLRRRPHARVVNVVSDNVNVATFDVEALVRPTKLKKLFGSYMMSKQALAHATAYLARQERWSGVELVSVTPGANKTAMTAGAGMPRWLLPIRALFFAKPEVGAGRLFFAATELVESGTVLQKNQPLALRWEMDGRSFAELFGSAVDVPRSNH